jgi:membrane protein required for colicin V production
MSFFDWFLIAVLAYSTIMAFVRGILLELFALGGLIAGILLACWNYGHVALLFGRLISTPAIAQIVAFALILASVMILSALLGKALHHTADAIGLGFFDRLLGAVFGFFRGCLLGVAILIAMAAFVPQSSWTQNSRLSPYFLAGVHAVSFVVPHDLRQLILNGVAQLKHNAPDWIKPPQ